MFRIFQKNKKEPENLSEVLRAIEDVSRELVGLRKEVKTSLNKVGMVRFNPFNEVGGDQSFAIAVLDANDDGFVITSHYGREANRVYAKPIKNGQSIYNLSKEENEAINKARKLNSTANSGGVGPR